MGSRWWIAVSVLCLSCVMHRLEFERKTYRPSKSFGHRQTDKIAQFINNAAAHYAAAWSWLLLFPRVGLFDSWFVVGCHRGPPCPRSGGNFTSHQTRRYMERSWQGEDKAIAISINFRSVEETIKTMYVWCSLSYGRFQTSRDWPNSVKLTEDPRFLKC